jgi:hypothetical protein
MYPTKHPPRINTEAPNLTSGEVELEGGELIEGKPLEWIPRLAQDRPAINGRSH